MSKGKIAFLFLTYGDLEQEGLWKAYFKQADPELFALYCHPKEKNLVSPDSLLCSHIIDRHYETAWGHVSVVKALLAMMQEVYKDPEVTRCVILTGACAPLTSFQKFYDHVGGINKGILGYTDPGGRVNDFRHGAFIDPTFIPKDKFRMETPWGHVLLREHMKVFNDNDCTNHYIFVPIAEEHYFSNVWTHLGKDLQQNFECRHILKQEWGKPGEPCAHAVTIHNMDQEYVQNLREEGYYFMRKVSKDTQADQDYILHS